MLEVEWTFLGRVPYRRALEIQYHHAREVARGRKPCLFLLEHPPTVTLGRQARSTNLRLPERAYAERGIKVFRVQRGGDVTYHGPGQLVGYPVASLESVRCSVPDWVQGHAEALIRFLASRGIKGEWSSRFPGVWVGREKIAALGFHLAHRISTHGFAVNLDPDLAAFKTIVPCGLKSRGVTSLAKLGVPVPQLSEAAEEIAHLMAEVFGWRLRELMIAPRITAERGHGARVPSMA